MTCRSRGAGGCWNSNSRPVNWCACESMPATKAAAHDAVERTETGGAELLSAVLTECALVREIITAAAGVYRITVTVPLEARPEATHLEIHRGRMATGTWLPTDDPTNGLTGPGTALLLHTNDVYVAGSPRVWVSGSEH